MSSTDHVYFLPRKVILTKENLEAFQQSKTHETIVSYVTTLNESVVGVKLTDDVPVSTVRKSDRPIPSLGSLSEPLSPNVTPLSECEGSP